ncbi:MAG: glycerophosphodiester phosphodiesterase [bacterium]
MGISPEKGTVIPVILGHRGAPKVAPQNTLSSFKMALEMGADGVELDVRLTKDRKFVIIHDPMVDNVTNGKGYVGDYTLVELKRLDAGSWFSKEFQNERIPTLEEALDILRSFKIVNIEIKNDPIPCEGIEEIFLEFIFNTEIRNRVIVSSFDHSLLLRLKRLDDSINTGVLYSCKPENPNLLAIDVKANSLHPFWPSIGEDTVRDAHNVGLKIFPWTVDEESYMRILLEWNVDGIITNSPELALKVRSEISSSKDV